ncbi:MAG: cation-translocating P-type ATPase [Phycisphaerales bacterium]|nr:cation-translocating P-type ATPase [Phycisphaerales bacterium]
MVPHQVCDPDGKELLSINKNLRINLQGFIALMLNVTALPVTEFLCDYCRLPIPSRHHPSQTDGPNEPIYCCYGCRFAAQITHARGEKGQATWMLTRLGVAIFLSMSVMVFSLYLYGQDVYQGGVVSGSNLSKHLASFMQYASLVFATPVLFLLGLPIFLNALTQWRNGIASTDALVFLGVAAAFSYSFVSTLRESGSTYYETACMILVLVTLGRWLEASGKLKASEAVEALEAWLPQEVSIRRDNETMTVRTETLRQGDLVTVPAGERIVVDGVIESGRANIDEQIVTGESRPLVKQTGDTVRAGTVNLDGALTIRATAVGTTTTVGRLMALLESAKSAKGRYERLTDRVVVVFLPLTICLALVGGAWGYWRGGADEAIMSALAVMLIACPCALGIATPMAIWMALGHAAANGVLFKTGEAIEKLAHVRAFCFDKTGTLTTGLPDVVSFASSNDCADRLAIASAAGLANVSTHVAAKGVAAFAERKNVKPNAISDPRTVAGRGLVGHNQTGKVFLGNVAMMRENGLAFDETTQRAIQEALDHGRSIACIGWHGRVRGVFTLTETLRTEARQTLHTLKAAGCQVFVLTGDHAQRGRSIAKALEIETFAELLPEDKVQFVKQVRRTAGPTVMVGDGLSDAPALAAADVGVAMGCGADVSRESAGVCLLGDGLEMLPWLQNLAKRTVGTIKLNLFWAFFYNTIGMSLAVAGLLSPILAAALMVVSSLFVVTNSLRLGSRESSSSLERSTPALERLSLEATT